MHRPGIRAATYPRGTKLDNDQHSIQDSNEAYAVYVAQVTAEDLGVATERSSRERYAEFATYLHNCGLSLDEWEHGLYGKYKANVDTQVPKFVARLADTYHESTFDFELREKEERIEGNKADMIVKVSGLEAAHRVSVKNYIGAGGILKPQVSSGTFLSFACEFVFDRVGVGVYTDPRDSALFDGNPTFRGSNNTQRNAVLEFERREEFIEPLMFLDRCQQEMRAELLGPDCEFYDAVRVRSVVERIAQPAIESVLHIFGLLGEDKVRWKFLAKIGMDGKEEALFFDSHRVVDSITNPRYHELRAWLNAETTAFSFFQHRQNIRFEFTDGVQTFKTDVPFTINTNGAWYRPKQHYEGSVTYDDKGHDVDLFWGQRRPYKSREIATSTNTYVDLSKTGIFG